MAGALLPRLVSGVCCFPNRNREPTTNRATDAAKASRLRQSAGRSGRRTGRNGNRDAGASSDGQGSGISARKKERRRASRSSSRLWVSPGTFGGGATKLIIITVSVGQPALQVWVATRFRQGS